MAWQSGSAMAGGGGGQGGDGGPLGTEYTLQGASNNKDSTESSTDYYLFRGDAISTDRMASTRARPQCLGDRTSGDEIQNWKIGG